MLTATFLVTWQRDSHINDNVLLTYGHITELTIHVSVTPLTGSQCQTVAVVMMSVDIAVSVAPYTAIMLWTCHGRKNGC